MRTIDYSALAASAPIDRQAAMARDGAGEHYDVPIPAHVERWDAPPPQERRPPHDAPRLEGRVFGSGMRVVRYHGKRSNGARWLVRCACGAYELRSTKAVNTAPADHACAACEYVRKERLNYGRDAARPDWRDLRGALLKFKMSADEGRYVLALVKGARPPADFTPGQKADLLDRLLRRFGRAA